MKLKNAYVQFACNLVGGFLDIQTGADGVILKSSLDLINLKAFYNLIEYLGEMLCFFGCFQNPGEIPTLYR